MCNVTQLVSNIQVEACTSVGCSVSETSQHFQTLPAPPEGVPAPHLYSETPTSVLLSWGAPEQSNGPLERWETVTFTSVYLRLFILYINVSRFLYVLCVNYRWLIERRVAGTTQISTVGHLLPDPPPLSFLDSSSALSPWSTYQYRLVLQNQAGKASGNGAKQTKSYNGAECECQVLALIFDRKRHIVTCLQDPGSASLPGHLDQLV